MDLMDKIISLAIEKSKEQESLEEQRPRNVDKYNINFKKDIADAVTILEKFGK